LVVCWVVCLVGEKVGRKIRGVRELEVQKCPNERSEKGLFPIGANHRAYRED